MSDAVERLGNEVLKCAERVVQMSRDRAGQVLDYSDASIDLVDEMLAEAAVHGKRMSDAALRRLSQDVGCYILEVARRNNGGAYQWSAERNEPALVIGEPYLAITLFCWDKVYGRLRGGESHGIRPFYAGFVARVSEAKQGDRVVFL